jgi:hypothetical protein
LHYILVRRHIGTTELNVYLSGELACARYWRVQRHLFKCPTCLEKLIEIEASRGPSTSTVEMTKPISMVHYTADGPIYSLAEKRDEVWFARHWGKTLDGGRTLPTVGEANAYLISSFAEMFPEHRCSSRCGAFEPE